MREKPSTSSSESSSENYAGKLWVASFQSGVAGFGDDSTSLVSQIVIVNGCI